MLANNCKLLDLGRSLINSYLKLRVLMYAYDTIILCYSEERMKKAVIALYSYCNGWKLKLNCYKTKIVVFSKERSH